MKQINSLKKVIAVVAFLIMSLFTGLMAQIVGYTLASSGTATDGLSVNSTSAISIVGLTSSGFSSTNGWTTYSWNAVGTDAWVTSAISTEGYINISGSCQMKANTTYGPRDFKIQYSLNGSTWTDATTGGTVTLTNSLSTYNFTLPSECENKSTLYIRWVLNSTIRLDGGTLSTSSSYNASLKGVAIAGDAFSAPSTQASNISIISVTPTTIKVGCTNGNGTRRIIVINNTNSFSDPVDDYFPTGNSTYAGTGEQVIYNGTGSQVTVTVPSATNEYWFRVYDFNKMDDLTRYNIATASENPKQCLLETIHTPTVANIRLTRANLGATITLPASGTIVERGIFWSTTSPVDETSNMMTENTSAGGVFSLSDIDVDRGTTIYFKGYVTNLSGTIMSEEGSFSNVPVFSGVGNWEDATKWNVQEVPGANGDVNYGSVEDSPKINGTCTLTATNNVTNLTINSAGKLTINPAVLMRVDGTLVNNAGGSGLLIKSSSTQANGSLIFASGTPVGSVEMYSKAYWNLNNPSGSKYAWQYFGIPLVSLNYSTVFSNCYVRKWDENVDDYYNVWVVNNNNETLQLDNSSVLTAGQGYELVQQSPKTYTFTGTLYNSDFNKTLTYTSSAYFKGQSVLANPYTAAIDIASLSFGANTEEAVYLYNTGTYSDWLAADAENTPGSGPGTYTVSTPGSAGLMGVPSQIPSMQGFVVIANASSGSISFPYNSLLENSSLQRAKTTVKKYGTMIDLVGENFSDRMWLMKDDNCSEGFDNGYDGRKFLGAEGLSQVFGIAENGDYYQIDAIQDYNNTYIGVVPGNESSLTLKFEHQNIDEKYSKIMLIDLLTNNVTDITSNNSEYTFAATSDDPVKRFKIVAETNVTTPVDNVIDGLVNVYSAGHNIIVDNKTNHQAILVVYDNTGKKLLTKNISASMLSNIDTKLSNGVYIVNVLNDTHKTTKSIIIK